MEHLTKKKLENAQSMPFEQSESISGGSMMDFYQKAGNQAMNDLLGIQQQASSLSQQMQSKVQKITGLDVSDVSVVHNSAQPDAFGAHSFTRGNEIHLSPGREQDLGHELWHVVQQRQGNVAATGSAGGFLTNESASLEREADRMGAQLMSGSMSMGMDMAAPMMATPAPAPAAPVMQFKKRSDPKGASTWDLMRNMFFGSKEDRAKKGRWSDRMLAKKQSVVADDESIDVNVPRELSFSQDRFHTGTEENPGLIGTKYSPLNQEKNNGKSIIVFSGSGGSNFEQMQEFIEEYTKAGYTVYGADYRGFGDNIGDDSMHISEKSLNEDAHEIFKHVQRDMGIGQEGSEKTNNDIILHGFSMGGAVASRLAADISEKAQQAGDNSQKLGGLTLHSSMKDLYHAAHGTMGGGLFGKIAGSLSRKHLGAFSVEDALEDIHAADPTLPLNLISGKDTLLNDRLQDQENAGFRAKIKQEKKDWKKTKKKERKAAKKQGKEAYAEYRKREAEEETRKKEDWKKRERYIKSEEERQAQNRTGGKRRVYGDQLSLKNTGLDTFAKERNMIVKAQGGSVGEGYGDHLFKDRTGVYSAPTLHMTSGYRNSLEKVLNRKRQF